MEQRFKCLQPQRDEGLPRQLENGSLRAPGSGGKRHDVRSRFLANKYITVAVKVQDLGAENMKKYWKLEELDQIPM